MPVKRFPNPRHATEEGLLALGGDLSPESLDLAYSQGVFPWPIEGYPLAWFCPPKRAILVFSELHIPRSLEKARRRCGFRFTMDQAFNEVIENCADVPRPGQDGTWITEPMISAYQIYHAAGRAHSVEVWGPGDGAAQEELIGGIYGVDCGGAFAGESMFHSRPNASKLALLHLIEHLRTIGLDWMDIQMLTPHMKALGAREVSRDEFLERLAETRARGLKLFAPIES